MCLATIDTQTKHTRKRIGYKVVVMRDGELFPRYQHQDTLFKIGKEATAKGRAHIQTDAQCGSYKPGFHSFLNKEAAMVWKHSHAHPGERIDARIFKVSFRKVTASGVQILGLATLPVVVSRYVTLLEEV